MANEQETAGSRNPILILLFVLLAAIAVIMIGVYKMPNTPGCTFCVGGSKQVASSETTKLLDFPKSNLPIKEDTGLKLPMSPSQLVESKKSGLQCDFGVSTLIIESVVNFSEVSLPMVGIGKEGMSLRETHTDHGRVTTGTLVTCANLVKKNFWIGFDGDYSPVEENDLKASVHIMDLHFQSGKDFDLVACDEGDDNPDECRELGVHDDALHTFYAIVWR